jgi:Kef-type K+ transport system membrane component KefB
MATCEPGVLLRVRRVVVRGGVPCAGAHDFGVLVFVIVMACLAKFLPTLIVSRIVTKQSWRFCTSLGVLMNTRGLVELVVLNIGLDNGILSIKL